LYDEWLLPIRERFGQQLTQVLATLAGLHEERREYPSAIRQAERLVAQDHLCEAHYQLLIRLHAANHDRASALRAYHQCMRTLRRELAVEPGAETRGLFEKLLKAEAVSAPRAELPSSDAAAPPPMIGRRREWERLQECWRDAAGGPIRMAAILGEPGIGKSIHRKVI
jgi:predicted ATPase